MVKKADQLNANKLSARKTKSIELQNSTKIMKYLLQ